MKTKHDKTSRWITDITSQTFGLLTALRPTDKRTYGAVVWECECKCGNVIERSIRSLQTIGKGNQSCGCLASEIIKTNRQNANFIDGTCIEKIRAQTLLQNNTSGIRGVHWDRNANKWRAVIYFKGKQIHLGLFSNIDDAAKIRKAAEDVYFKPIIEEFEARKAEIV